MLFNCANCFWRRKINSESVPNIRKFKLMAQVRLCIFYKLTKLLIIIQNAVTDAKQEMQVELHLIMFVSFALQQKDCFKCHSTSIASVTAFCKMTTQTSKSV